MHHLTSDYFNAVELYRQLGFDYSCRPSAWLHIVSTKQLLSELKTAHPDIDIVIPGCGNRDTLFHNLLRPSFESWLNRRRNEKAYRWSEEEVEILYSLEGRCILPELCRRYRLIAKKRGLPHRTDQAIWSKTQRLGWKIRCDHGTYTMSSLAEILGIPKFRVRQWVESGKLYTTKQHYSHIISTRSLEIFAQNHPSLLSCYPKESLLYLFEPHIVKSILSYRPANKYRAAEVIHLPTGTKYASIREAARQTFRSRGAMRSEIARNPDWKLIS